MLRAGQQIHRLPAAQIVLVSLEVLGRPVRKLRLLAGAELDCERRDDLLLEGILHGEHVVQLAVVALGPQRPVADRVDQLGGDTDPVGRTADAAFQHVAHAQFLRHLRRLRRLPLVGEDRVARDHEQPRELGQIGDQVLGQAVDEEFLLGVVTQIAEGQHGDGRLFGQHQRRVGWRRLWIEPPKQDARSDDQDRRGQQCRQPPPSGSTGCWRFHDRRRNHDLRRRSDLPGVHRLGDVLDALRTEVLELQGQLAAKRQPHGISDADPARFGQALHSRRHVDAIAEDVGAIDDHVAEVDSDPKLYLPVVRQPFIAAGDLPLDDHRAGHRLGHGTEFCQYGVARIVDHAAAVAFDDVPDQAEVGADRPVRAELVLSRSAGCNQRCRRGESPPICWIECPRSWSP